MTEYTSEELLLEQEMSDLGEERYYSLLQSAQAAGNYSVTVPGRALSRKFLGQVEERIDGWMQKAYEKNSIANGEAFPVLEALKPPLCAMLTCAVVIDRLHEWVPALDVQLTIAKALEDEFRLRRAVAESPELLREIRRKTASAGPSRKRRLAIERAAKRGVLPPAFSLATKRQLGDLLLQIFWEVTGLIEFDYQKLPRMKHRRIVGPSDELLQWMQRANVRAATAMTFFMPMLDRPEDWTGPTGGGYLTDLVLKRPIARFRGRHQEQLVAGLDAQQEYPLVLGALNRVQSTAYCVNEDVLEVLEASVKAGNAPLPDHYILPLPIKPEGEVSEEVWLDYRRECGRVRRENKARGSRGILVSQTVNIARKFLGREFFFPHRLDFRGRVYSIPRWLSPQGPDLSRGLIRFARPSKLTDEGLIWLNITGANLWGINGTLGDRAAWGAEQEDLVRRVYSDPLEHRDWHGADEPFQFLAWCLEMGKLYEVGASRFETTLPVHVDASNNGLQLFSLMSGDAGIARWTNAIACPDGPMDLYVEVARRAHEIVKRRALEENKPHVFDGLLRFLGDGVPRACAKRPVMTMPYSITSWSAQNYVYEWFKEKHPEGHPDMAEHAGLKCRALGEALLEATELTCPGPVAVMDWLKGAARAAVAQGHRISWRTAAGWPVMQEYRKHRMKEVSSLIGARRLSVRVDADGLLGRAHSNGISPNFVHSVDGAILAHACHEFRDHPLSTIHDSFATTAPHVEELLSALRRSVATCAVEKNPLISAAARWSKDIVDWNEEPPLLGEITPDQVLESTYLFS